MPSSRFAVASSPVELHDAMSPAPTSTGSPLGTPVLTISCGELAPVSRESYRASLVDDEVIPKLNVPLPVTAEVTSTVYQVLRATDPSVPSVAPSIAGWLL